MLIKVTGKNSNTGRYRAKDMNAAQRAESLAERNYKTTGDSQVDKRALNEINQAIKEAKDSQ